MDVDTLSDIQAQGSGVRRPRVIFFGMECAFSYPALQSLLAQNIDVCAIVIPATSAGSQTIRLKEPLRTARGAFTPLRVMNSSLSPSIVHLAWQRHIPVWEVSKLADNLTNETLNAYQPDLICVACFPRIIPSSLLALPRAGCLNVHPSLLPANRGPLPLFWSLRQGDEMTGVTIHYMTEALDSGDILAQETIPIPEGIRYTQLEERCALRGGELLADTVWHIYRGQISPRPQDEALHSYYPYPSDTDYTVSIQGWSARHLYTFIRGVASEDTPVKLLIEGRSMIVADAISYSLKGEPDLAMIEKGLQRISAEGEGRRYSAWNLRCCDGWIGILAF